jgi:hypothetical protein
MLGITLEQGIPLLRIKLHAWKEDGIIDPKAISMQNLWSIETILVLVQENKITAPENFIRVPHMSFVWGAENVAS